MARPDWLGCSASESDDQPKGYRLSKTFADTCCKKAVKNMIAHGLTPILNVSNFAESVVWFEKLGWEKSWDWGDPPTFGGVCSGVCQIFLCLNGQGGRGKSDMAMTFGPT